MKSVFLVAIDLASPQNLLKWVSAVMNPNDKLELITVLSNKVENDPLDQSGTSDMVRMKLRQMILELQQELGFDFEAEIKIKTNTTGERIGSLIVEEATKNTTMIVVGFRTNALFKSLVGSTSSFVIQHAPCPVTILKN